MADKCTIGVSVFVCLPAFYFPSLFGLLEFTERSRENIRQPVATKPTKVILAILLHYLVNMGVCLPACVCVCAADTAKSFSFLGTRVCVFMWNVCVSCAFVCWEGLRICLQNLKASLPFCSSNLRCFFSFLIYLSLSFYLCGWLWGYR